MKKFFTFIAMALFTMGASAKTTVWEYDYAKLATDHVTYQGKIDVVRITDTKYKACGTDVYPFTCGEVVAASDVMISRGDGKVSAIVVTDVDRNSINMSDAVFTVSNTTGIKEVGADGMQADGKYLKDGKIIIKKGSKLYNAVGAITK